MTRMYAASALWALVYDHQQVKGALKRLVASAEVDGEGGAALPLLLKAKLEAGCGKVAMADLPTSAAHLSEHLSGDTPQRQADYSLLQVCVCSPPFPL